MDNSTLTCLHIGESLTGVKQISDLGLRFVRRSWRLLVYQHQTT